MEELIELNNNFKTICQNKNQRKIDPDLDKFCKKKYDNFKDNITSVMTPGGSSFTVDRGIAEPAIGKLKILLNGVEYELSDGENIIYFSLNGENYKKNSMWEFKELHIRSSS